MKQITIKEDGVSKSESVDFINTQVAGGSANWMPEDEAQEGVFYVHANGEYVPSDYGLYGFYAVGVMVPGGNGAETIQPGRLTPTYVTPLPATGLGASVIGVDPTDGAMYRTEIQDVDGVPTLVKTKVADSKQDYKPTSMKILIKPAKLSYKAGEKIQYAGLVVQLLDSTGYTFVDEKFPQGIISWSPVKNLLHPEYNLITPVEYAHDGNGDEVLPQSIGGVEIAGFPFSSMSRFKVSDTYWIRTEFAEPSAYVSVAFKSSTEYVYTVIWASSKPFRYGGEVNTPRQQEPTQPSTWNEASTYTYDNKTVYYGYVGTETRNGFVCTAPYFYANKRITNDESKIYAWAMVYGDVKSDSNTPIQWKSPYDNKTYEDAFKIDVESGGENTSSGSSSSGGSSSGGGGGHSF